MLSVNNSNLLGLLLSVCVSTTYFSPVKAQEPLILNVETVSEVGQEALDSCTKIENCKRRISESYDFLGESLRRTGRTGSERDAAIQLADTLKESLNELNERYERAVSNLRKAKREANDLTDKLDKASTDKDRFNAQMKEAENELADLISKLADAEKRVTELENQLREANAEIDNLKSQLADAEKRATDQEREFSAELGNLKSQLADAEKKIADREREFSAKLDSLNGKLLEAKNNAKAFEAQLGDEQSRNAKLEDDLEKAKILNSDLEDKLSVANAEIARLKDELNSADSELATANEIITKLRGQLADANSKIDSLESRDQENRSKIAQLEAENYKLRQENERLQILADEGIEAKETLAALIGDLSTITVADLRPVTLTEVNPQDWLINNVYLRYLRNKRVDGLIPLAGSEIATHGVEQIQLEMNQWLSRKGLTLIDLGLPQHAPECGLLLCSDGIVGIRTRGVATYIDSIDPKFWPGANRKIAMIIEDSGKASY